MPTYSYACTQCGHEFDVVQSMSEASLTQCPECSGTLRKLFGNVGVMFKGSGFYRTDSRSGSGKSESSSSGGSGSTPSGGSSSGGTAGGSGSSSTTSSGSGTGGSTSAA